MLPPTGNTGIFYLQSKRHSHVPKSHLIEPLTRKQIAVQLQMTEIEIFEVDSCRDFLSHIN